MVDRHFSWLLIVFVQAITSSGCRTGRPDAPRPRPLRLGLERIAIRYDDAQSAAKRVLFDRINHDRASHGVPPVKYEPRASLVGDLYCLDLALSGAWGHWDLSGRAPYLRWALAGGVDYHAQNAATYAISPGVVTRPLQELLLESHENMMAETPPADGHRRTILDPNFTHVGIGVALVGGQFRMSEEFTRVGFEWIEIPSAPLRIGQTASFSGRTLPGFEVSLAEIAYEPPPRALSLAELRGRRSYSYPRVVRTLRPRPPPFMAYESGGYGEFLPGRTVRFRFPLSEGPGHYFVVCSLRARGHLREPGSPASAALVTAIE